MKIELDDALVAAFQRATEDGLQVAEDILHQRGTPDDCIMRLMRSTVAREDAQNAIWKEVCEQIGGQQARVDTLRAGLEAKLAQREGRVMH